MLEDVTASKARERVKPGKLCPSCMYELHDSMGTFACDKQVVNTAACTVFKWRWAAEAHPYPPGWEDVKRR